MSENKKFGYVQTDCGQTEAIVKIFKTITKDREVTIGQTESGNVFLQTKSSFGENADNPVIHKYLYTPHSFALFLETMVLGSQYFNIDMAQLCNEIYDSSPVNYEYGGAGVPSFASENNTEPTNSTQQ